MKTRDAVAFESLDRVVQVIARHEPLRQKAAESEALDRLNEYIAQIHSFAQAAPEARLTSQWLTARKESMKRLLWEQLDAVRRAAEISIESGTLVPELTPPPEDDQLTKFAVQAGAIAGVAKQHEAALRRAGLDWSIIADIEQLAEALQDTRTERDANVALGQAANNAIPIAIRAGRRQVGLLRRQLKGVMTPEMLGEWTVAASLGRKHRRPERPQLAAQPVVLALPAPDAATLPPAPVAAPLGIVDKARRFVLRLILPEKQNAAAAPTNDVLVEEIRRLPSSTESNTGRDDRR